MMRSILADAFDHHVWATLALLDACATLSPEQLETTVPGTYGSIIATLRHLVGADRSYLSLLSDGAADPLGDEETADVPALRAAMVPNGPAWDRLVATPDMDPDVMVVRYREDGSEGHAPLGIRLAQVLHHGTDHRSQVCTALTGLGVEPPAIDAWDFAASGGRLNEVPRSA